MMTKEQENELNEMHWRYLVGQCFLIRDLNNILIGTGRIRGELMVTLMDEFPEIAEDVARRGHFPVPRIHTRKLFIELSDDPSLLKSDNVRKQMLIILIIEALQLK